ncbi:MAG: hypothetical protein ABWX96_00395, partial [Propionibacteriaceae bacterium]
ALPTTSYAVSQWLGDEDCGRLLRGALSAEVPFGTYFGVSVEGRARWDIGNGETDLGYRPGQTPPQPVQPEPEQTAGNCLMVPPG